MHYNIIEYIRNKYFDELKDCSPYIRQAMLFQHMTEDIPLRVKDTDYIAGWYGYEDVDAPSVMENKDFPYVCVLDDKQKQIRETLRNELKMEIHFNPAHTCIDYKAIVQNGLAHYMTLVDEALCKSHDDDCLLSMKISLNAAYNFAGRFAHVVHEKAKNAENPEQKRRFESIYSALCHVPRFGARNFLEAVQSVWIMHTLIPMAEMSWASISVGRIDQYLYPFYKKHIADGGKKEDIKEILKNLFMLLDSYGDGACAMNIGGMDAEGHDMINDLSRLFIEVEKEMSMRAPIFAVRITPDIPEDVFDTLIDFNLFKIGQPTFYGELPCRQAMIGRGMSEREAINFSANSCMGLIMAGREFADMWGIKFNSHLPLELAVNYGRSLNSNFGFEFLTAPKDITDFEELLHQYDCYLSELIAVCTNLYEAVSLEQEANKPDPLLSALTDGCIKNGRDRANGATYNTVTIETMGLINTCDALMAIKELVFEQKKYTLEELVTAVKSNYEGYEKILLDISKCKKYGMNDSTVNALFKQMCKMVSVACKRVCHDNRLFLPSLHTIDENVYYGGGLYATFDGRKKGQPVNRNANPSILLQKTEHTSHILSASAFDQTEFSGGQPIDLYFDKAWFETKESRDKIKALIRTYFQLGGLQLQVNSIDIELLEKAHRAPEKYPFVIVRKGGYSVRFNEMSFDARENFINSAKQTAKTI